MLFGYKNQQRMGCPSTHDSVRSGLCLFDRRHQHRHLHERAFRRSPHLLHPQRHLRKRVGESGRYSQSGRLGHRAAIRNSTGLRPSLFVPEVAFDSYCTSPVSPICRRRSSSPVLRDTRWHCSCSLASIPGCRCRPELLRERRGPTSDYTQSLIDIQSTYINTNHPAFIVCAKNATTAHMSSPKRR